jgi:5-methylthioadenosine/S-adenosylhomocysteine deaminase
MPESLQTVDSIIDARWVIPVEPAGTILEQHSVIVAMGGIVDVLPSGLARLHYHAKRHVELAEHVLIPGLINLHTHAAMTLMRGLADDKSLMDWLNNHIWPVETRLVSHEFVHDGTLLACAEMLRGGVTCFNDMYFFPESAAQAVLHAHMRAAIGMIVIEFPSPYATDAMDYLNKGIALRDYLREEPLLSFCIAPHAPYTVSDKAFERIAVMLGELDVPLHIHMHETRGEIEKSLAQYGKRPLSRLQDLGLVDSNLIAVHAVHLTDQEVDLLASRGCHVAHCPSSNLKLASGIEPPARLLGSGINVGLGTDGAASNNRQDIFSEMRLAALIAKGATGDPTIMPAHTVLEMATLNAARALGLDSHIGSLTKGKRADITAVNLAALELSPCYDPLSHLVYAAGRENVSHVWVNGELLVDNGKLLHLDETALTAKAKHWKEKIKNLQPGIG